MTDIHPRTPPLFRAIIEGRIPRHIGVAKAISHSAFPQGDEGLTRPQMTEEEVEEFIEALRELGIVLEE